MRVKSKMPVRFVEQDPEIDWCTGDVSDVATVPMCFLGLPVELISYILRKCTVPDLCSLAQTCRTLRDIIEDDFLWLYKWQELQSQSKLDLPAVPPCQDAASLRCCCLRLLACAPPDDPPPPCLHCRRHVCAPDCLEVFERRVALDVGSKTSWLINSTFALERHPSVMVTPADSGAASSGSNGRRKVPPCLLCRHRRQLLGYQTANHVDPKDYLFVHRNVRTGARCFPGGGSSQQHFLGDCSVVSLDACLESKVKDFPLWSEVYQVLSSVEPGCRILSPADCFRGNEREARDLAGFVGHLLEQHRMLDELRKPNVSLVLCEPHATSPRARQALVEALFRDYRISRLCLVSKAYATALLIGLDTCLVVDSGLSSTVVTLVVDGEAGPSRHCPVGGLALSRHLAESVKFSGEHRHVSLSSLDSSSVKSSCYLSYNIAVEERRRTTIKRDIFVRYKSARGSSILEKHSLGAELYLAPELMYCALGLPAMVKDLLEGLCPNLVRDLLGHVLLTGANTELTGFATRLIRDLQNLLPDYKHTINVNTYAGSRSWDAVMGATRVPLPCVPHPLVFIGEGTRHLPGSYLWISREDFILGTTELPAGGL